MSTHSDLAALVADFAADEPDAEQLADAVWRFRFDGDDGPFDVFVAAESESLLCSATRLEPVPTDRIAAIHELVLDLNSHLKLAWFDCHRSNGVISARASIDTSGVDADSVLLGNIVGAAVATMDRFMAAIDAVAAGDVEPADLRDAPVADDDRGPVLNLSHATDEEIDAFIDTVVIDHFDT